MNRKDLLVSAILAVGVAGILVALVLPHTITADNSARVEAAPSSLAFLTTDGDLALAQGRPLLEAIGCRVTAEVAKETFTAGEPVELVLRALNDGSAPTDLSVTVTLEGIGRAPMDALARVLVSPRIEPIALSAHFHLDPGVPVTKSLTLSGPSEEGQAIAALAPARYLVRLSVVGDGPGVIACGFAVSLPAAPQ